MRRGSGECCGSTQSHVPALLEGRGWPAPPGSRFRLGAFHWIAGAPPEPVPENLTVKVRHGPDLVPAVLRLAEPTPAADGPQPSELLLSRPDDGVAPGQFAVFYAGPRCLGSARITSRGA